MDGTHPSDQTCAGRAGRRRDGGDKPGPDGPGERAHRAEASGGDELGQNYNFEEWIANGFDECTEGGGVGRVVWWQAVERAEQVVHWSFHDPAESRWHEFHRT